MKNRAARGGPAEAETDKVPCTSKFHFSKGKYGHIVLAWHGVLIQKAKANFPDICAQARKISGATNDEAGNGNQVAHIDPKIRTRVGLDSESESGSEGEPAKEDELDDCEDDDDGDHDEDRGGHDGDHDEERRGHDEEHDEERRHDEPRDGDGIEEDAGL